MSLLQFARRRAVIFDLDNTISSTMHREGLLNLHPIEWSDYHGRMVLDAPIQHTLDKLLAHRAAGDKVIVVTLRPERFKPFTEDWLKANGVPYDEVYTRAEGDYRRSADLKHDIYVDHIKDRYDVVAAYDDTPSILQMWSDEGIDARPATDPGLPPLEGVGVVDPRYPNGRPPSDEWLTPGVPKPDVMVPGVRVVPPYLRVRNGQLEHVDGYVTQLAQGVSSLARLRRRRGL